MKKMLLLTIALLALGAAVAMADSMNLGYVCRTALNTATASTNDFNTSLAGPCDDGISYVATKGLVCSFKNTTTMLGWGGTSVQVDILTATLPLPDFWNVGAGGCRVGSLSAPNVVVGATNCTNMYIVPPPLPAPPDGQNDNNNITVDIPNGRVRMKSFHSRNTTQVDLPPPISTGGYLANNLRIDPNNGNDALAPGFCVGCADPACIVLNQVEYFSLSENRQIATTELRSFVTWNGGTGPTCPGSTPTRSSTWGQVKALYR